MRALGRLPLELTVPTAVGGTIVAFALGSSSVETLNELGKALRWAALVVLLGLAAWCAVRRQERVSLPLPFTLAAASFLALLLVSSLWSVDPPRSFARAGSLVILLAVASLLTYASGGRRSEVERVLAGVLAGAAAIALAGLLVLAADPSTAIDEATLDLPARYKGLGENPNTAPLLFALALPIAAWFALRPGPRVPRVAALAAVLLFSGSISASVSRGALVGFAGLLFVAALAPVRRLTRVVAVTAGLALLGATIAGQVIPQPLDAPPARAERPPPPQREYVDVQAVSPLEFDIGPDRSGRRSLLGSGGRLQAWQGALDQAGDRALLGYGFGSEEKVFVDRYSSFAGGLPENSYIGLVLQLGAAGLVSFLLLAGALVASAARTLQRPEAVVCLGVFVTGLILATVQSYVYSVGNIATATLWICGVLALPVVRSERQE